MSVTRTDAQRPRIEAVDLPGGVRVDGALDGEVWQRAVPATDSTKTLWTFRGDYLFSTDMFVDALGQYDPGLEQIPPGRSLALKGTWTVAF